MKNEEIIPPPPTESVPLAYFAEEVADSGTSRSTRLDINGSKHAFTESEKTAFVKHINKVLDECPELSHVLPINPASGDIFEAVKDGILLCKLISVSVPNSIDEKKIVKHFRDEKSKPYNQLINLNLCLDAARSIGAVVVNVGAEDIMEGKPYLIFGLLWQIIKIGMLQELRVDKHPELLHLKEGEEDISKMIPEDLLVKWVNWYLKKSGADSRIKNFSSDVKNSVAYTHLMHQLAPEVCSLDALTETDMLQRANIMLSNAEKLGCRSFVTAEDVVNGNERLNLVFAATLFNKHIGMVRLGEEIEQENSTLLKENECLRSKIEKLEEQLQEAALSKAYQEDLIQNTSRKYADLEVRYKDSRANCDDLKTQIIQVNEMNARLREYVQMTEEEKKSVEATKENLVQKVSQLQVKMEETAQQLERERMSLETSEECGASLAQDLEELRSKQEKMEYLIEHLKIERMKSYMHIERLRILYNSFPTTEALCEAIYKSLTLECISQGAAKVGYLTKKARNGSSWKYRYFVLRDNFLFYFRSDKDPSVTCSGVIRVDDAIIKFAENPTKKALKDQWLLCIEVPNNNESLKSSSFYIAGDDHELESWKSQIKTAAGWWTKKSYRRQ
ncbi:hypothetical protein MP638_003204 [Amoeboaphelidium occidentale]|nr:hypothetical protein MP638_003204 [Amoeboaphelidium occidentale]